MPPPQQHSRVNAQSLACRMHLTSFCIQSQVQDPSEKARQDSDSMALIFGPYTGTFHKVQLAQDLPFNCRLCGIARMA